MRFGLKVQINLAPDDVWGSKDRWTSAPWMGSLVIFFLRFPYCKYRKIAFMEQACRPNSKDIRPICFLVDHHFSLNILPNQTPRCINILCRLLQLTDNWTRYKSALAAVLGAKARLNRYLTPRSLKWTAKDSFWAAICTLLPQRRAKNELIQALV